jgi:hypothetical protein
VDCCVSDGDDDRGRGFGLGVVCCAMGFLDGMFS